jgi:hypothetical protein
MQMGSPYRALALNIAMNLVIMFFVMYSMISKSADLVPNINNFYMALLMAAPMVALMILSMGRMYDNKRLNYMIGIGSLAVFVVVFGLVRTQSPVGDRQFLRSMIPHHSSAILMCEKASISDPEIKLLCGEIISSQTREIAQMRTLLNRQ